MLAGEMMQALFRGDDSEEADVGGLLLAETLRLIRDAITREG
jgi:hypothetical protein